MTDFDGIPIPLTLETILDAMVATAYTQSDVFKETMEWAPYLKRVERQHNAFRARILRMDAEKVEIIKILDSQYVVLTNALADKDKRIAELEEEVEYHKYAWTEDTNG